MSQFTLFFASILSSMQSAWTAIPVFTTIASPFIVKIAVIIAAMIALYTGYRVICAAAPAMGRALRSIASGIVDWLSKG